MEWLQGTLNVLIVLFLRYEMVANVAKSNTMTCQSVTLWYVTSEEAVVRRFTGRRVMY